MIEITNLSKYYKDKKRGRIEAVKDVSFRCEPGQVYGLLGPNGAGKTTTLRILSTALKPSEGGGHVCGHDIVKEPTKVRRRIGFLSANTGLYGRLTPRESLRYFGRLFNVSDKDTNARIADLAATFDMNDFLDRPCDKLSTGMKQKVNIARTVLHAPEVLVFDEPTSGLDVLTSRTIVQFIRHCREEGKTVIFSTHIMAEVEKLCDRVGVIHQGRMFYDGTVADLRARHGEDLEDAFVHLIGEAA